MMNVCYNCGEYRADKVIDPEGPYAICLECGHKHPFLQLPLLMVCGPSGSGKSTVCQRLVGKLRDVVTLEADILWRPEFDRRDEGYRDFFETWLRMCENISQSGRPVLLFCGGGIPQNVEPCVEARYLSTIYYLALVCEDGDLEERLRRRPAWRNSADPAFIEDHISYNHWFRDTGQYGEPPIELIDTSRQSVEAVAEKLAQWVGDKVSVGPECPNALGGLRGKDLGTECEVDLGRLKTALRTKEQFQDPDI